MTESHFLVTLQVTGLQRYLERPLSWTFYYNKQLYLQL